MKLTTSIKVTSQFPALERRIDREIQGALADAAQQAAQVARAAAAPRSRTGKMGNIRVAPPRRNAKGWDAAIISPVFYAWMQEHGTLGNRRRKLKRPSARRRAAPPGSGVRPLRFLTKGRAAGRKALLSALERALNT
jgi:hypothetical protein